MILSMPMVWQITIIIGLVLLFVGTYFLDHKMNSKKNDDENEDDNENDNCKSCGSNNCFLKTENFDKIKKEIAKENKKDEK
ncbi:MAG: hypothetical protein WCS56_00805 [Bacilli bacterium]